MCSAAARSRVPVYTCITRDSLGRNGCGPSIERRTEGLICTSYVNTLLAPASVRDIITQKYSVPIYIQTFHAAQAKRGDRSCQMNNLSSRKDLSGRKTTGTSSLEILGAMIGPNGKLARCNDGARMSRKCGRDIPCSNYWRGGWDLCRGDSLLAVCPLFAPQVTQ